MTMTKMTKIDMYEQILTHLTDADEIAFIKHEIELTAKKNASRSSKPTKVQAANVELMNEIYDFMEIGQRYTVTELTNAVPCLNGLTVNKVNALVRGLKLDGRVVRSEEKGRAYFTKK